MSNLAKKWTAVSFSINKQETLEIGIEHTDNYGPAFLLFGHHGLNSERSFSGIFFGTSSLGVSYNPLISSSNIEITEGRKTENKKLKIKNNSSSQFSIKILSLSKLNSDILTFNIYV